MDAEDMLFLLYTSGTTGTAQGGGAYPRRLPGGHQHHAQVGVRHQGRGYLVVRGRSRLDHRPQLHRLRSADPGRNERDLRGRTHLPAPRPLVGDRRKVGGDDPLYRAHRHPGPDALWPRLAGPLRPLQPAPAGHRRRADQPGSLGVVSSSHRRRDTAPSWIPGGRPRPAIS